VEKLFRLIFGLGGSMVRNQSKDPLIQGAHNFNLIVRRLANKSTCLYMGVLMIQLIHINIR
jgi:hypothetical protein